MARTPANRRAWRVLLAFSVGLVLAGLAAELAVRLVARFSGRPHSAWLTRDVQAGALQWVGDVRQAARRAGAQEADDPAQEPEHVLSPFLGFEVSCQLREYASATAYFASAEGQRNFDVLILGGSVAAGAGFDGTGLIKELFESAPRLNGREVRVHVQGRGGYKAPQPAILCGLLFALGHRPDFVILLDGFNEVAIGYSDCVQGVHPLYPSIGHWAHLLAGPTSGGDRLDLLVDMRAASARAGGALAASLRWRLYYSAAASYVVNGIVNKARARYVELYMRYRELEIGHDPGLEIRGPGAPGDPAGCLDAAIRVWTESSRNLAGMCRVRGIPMVHVLQPTLYDVGSKSVTKAELETGTISAEWKEGVIRGYPLLRAAGESLRAAGFPFVDASKLFANVDRTVYYDCCHLIPEASAQLARFCVERALEELVRTASDHAPVPTGDAR